MTITEVVSSSELRKCEHCNRDISDELSIQDLPHDGTSRTIGICCHEHLASINKVSVPDSMRPDELSARLDQVRCSMQGVQLELESPDPEGNIYSLNCPGITQLRSTAGSYTDTQILDTAHRVPFREWPDSAKRLATVVKIHSNNRDKLVIYKWPDGVITAFHASRHQKKISAEELIGYYRKAALQFVSGVHANDKG